MRPLTRQFWLPKGFGGVAIWTPDRRLRVYLSSTLDELAEERRAVDRAVSALRLTPVKFEQGARPHPPRDVQRAYLAQSDIFIGLYWQSYGDVAPGAKLSEIEEDFDQAAEKPRLLYIKTPAPDRDARLSEFLDRIAGRASYRLFNSPRELARLVRDDLATLMSERFTAARSTTTTTAPPGTTVAASAVVPESALPELGLPESRRRRPRPLPVGTTSLIDRSGAIDDVIALLSEPNARLVTLTGPGGIGKTRLAAAVAERLGDEFGSVAFVPLASVASAELVLDAMGRSMRLDMAGTGSPLDALVEALADRRMLLVLDNLEQVVGVAADLSTLLAQCPGLAIIATSRTVLSLRAEQEYSVPPLAVPDDATDLTIEELASWPTVALFVDRARAVRRDFVLTPDNAAAVVEICRRLEGVPLAIELAAARIRVLDPEGLLRRLSRSLDSLGKGPVDLPERQQTLRATVEWSIDLLAAKERSLLENLAVFVDGWTMDAAAVVAHIDEERALDICESLARHSLIELDRTEFGIRARMLDTIREFVAERLEQRSDVEEIRRRHAEYFWLLAGQADARLRGVGQSDWLERLEIDAPNLAATVRWYLDHDRKPLPHMFRVLSAFWFLRDRMDEAREWIGEMLPDVDALETLPRAELLWSAVVAALEVGDDETAVSFRDRLTAMLDRIDDGFLRAVCRLAIAWTSPIDSDFNATMRLTSASLNELRPQDEPFWTALALGTIGFAESSMGRHESAIDDMTEARDIADRLDNEWVSVWTRVLIATDKARRGLVDEVWEPLDEGFRMSVAASSTRTISLSLIGYALAAFVAGDSEDAARLAGAGEGLRARAGLHPWPILRKGEADLLAQLADKLGAENFKQVYAHAAELNRRDAIAAVNRWRGTEIAAA